MDHINVLYTVDKNYVNYMLVSMCSLIENNSNMDICFHIICDGLEEIDFVNIDNTIKSFVNVDLKFYDFSAIKGLIEKYGIPEWNSSSMPNARLFFDACIRDVDRLLYLDSDTIVVNSLTGLSNYNNAIHMVRDSMPTNYWKSLSPKLLHYYNSGVMWIDVDNWKKNAFHDKIIHGLENRIPYKYPDQDLINLTLSENIYDLPPNYNLFSTDDYFPLLFLRRFYNKAGISRYSEDEMLAAKKYPIILHSTPFYGFKAWDGNSIHPFYTYYQEYFEKLGLNLNAEQSEINEELFRLGLYSRLICPSMVSSMIKQVKKHVKIKE